MCVGESDVSDADRAGSCVNTTEAVSLVATYQESELWRGVEEQLETLVENRHAKRGRNGGQTYATNFLWQFMIVSLRSLVNLLRNPMISFFQVCVFCGVENCVTLCMH